MPRPSGRRCSGVRARPRAVLPRRSRPTRTRPLLREPSAHGWKSSIVRPMDDARPPASPDPSVPPDFSRTGRLTREEATALLAEGDARLAAGELAEAGVRYSRVVGFDDASITAAALLGLGEARFRAGEDDAASRTGRPSSRSVRRRPRMRPGGTSRPQPSARAICTARSARIARRSVERRRPTRRRSPIGSAG
jgi:hypothetical protein